MNSMKKRLMSLLLAACMVLSLVPATALADWAGGLSIGGHRAHEGCQIAFAAAQDLAGEGVPGQQPGDDPAQLPGEEEQPGAGEPAQTPSENGDSGQDMGSGEAEDPAQPEADGEIGGGLNLPETGADDAQTTPENEVPSQGVGSGEAEDPAQPEADGEIGGGLNLPESGPDTAQILPEDGNSAQTGEAGAWAPQPLAGTTVSEKEWIDSLGAEVTAVKVRTYEGLKAAVDKGGITDIVLSAGETGSALWTWDQTLTIGGTVHITVAEGETVTLKRGGGANNAVLFRVSAAAG